MPFLVVTDTSEASLFPFFSVFVRDQLEVYRILQNQEPVLMKHWVQHSSISYVTVLGLHSISMCECLWQVGNRLKNALVHVWSILAVQGNIFHSTHGCCSSPSSERNGVLVCFYPFSFHSTKWMLWSGMLVANTSPESLPPSKPLSQEVTPARKLDPRLDFL